MLLDDMILMVEGWRKPDEGKSAPARAIDGTLHVLLRCRELGLEPTEIARTAADSIVTVFRPGAIYCDVEVDDDGRIQAVAPHQSDGRPTLYDVPDEDALIDDTLKMIQLRLSGDGC